MRAFLFVLAITLAVPAQAAPFRFGFEYNLKVDCESRDPTWMAMCRFPDVMDAYKQITDAFEKLHDKFPRKESDILEMNQDEWVGKLRECIFADKGEEIHNRVVYPCLKGQLDGRMPVLQALEKDPSSLLPHAADYLWIHPGYLKEFAKEYEGKYIRVFGAIGKIHCNTLPGTVRSEIERSGESVPAVFDNLTDQGVDFLCRKRPVTAWGGIVKLDANGRPYLASITMGGRP